MSPTLLLRVRTSSVLLVREVGSPHFSVSSGTLMALLAIHLPQRKVSSAEVANERRSTKAARREFLMTRMVALEGADTLLPAAPLLFTGNPIAFSIHLHARAILQEEGRFLAGMHLRTIDSSVADKSRGLAGRLDSYIARLLRANRLRQRRVSARKLRVRLIDAL